jgi:PRTRC genetic system protein C
MEIQTLTRKFKYNGIDLQDPGTGMTADEVRELYAMQFPELNNAVVEGPVTSGTEQTFTFVRAVGSKG